MECTKKKILESRSSVNFVSLERSSRRRERPAETVIKESIRRRMVEDRLIASFVSLVLRLLRRRQGATSVLVVATKHQTLRLPSAVCLVPLVSSRRQQRLPVGTAAKVNSKSSQKRSSTSANFVQLVLRLPRHRQCAVSAPTAGTKIKIRRLPSLV